MLNATLAMMSESTSPLANSPEGKRALFWLEFKAAALRRQNGRFIAKNEKRLEKRLKRSLDAQKKYIIEELKKLPEFNQKGMRIIERKGLLDGLKRLLGLMPKKDTMVDDMETYAAIVMLRGAATTIKNFKLAGMGISFTLRNEGAVRYMQALRTLHLSDYMGSISKTTKDEIIGAVTDSVMNGSTYQEVAGMIEKMGEEGVFSAARAQRIATNEIAKAYAFGNNEPLKEYKERTGREVWKSWIAEADPCPICLANAGEGWIKFDQSFSSGDGTDPAHPNCRCAIAYRFDDGTGSEND